MKNQPSLKLVIEGGLEDTQDGYHTQIALLSIFESALQLQQRKQMGYGEAWRDQGYMGNVGRVLGKVSRLRNMLWRDIEVNGSSESIEDSLMDLIVLSGFALINRRERNKWGPHS